jgi:hypothetical protein
MAFNIYHLWFFFFKKIHYFLFLIFFFTPAPVLDNQSYLQMNFQILLLAHKGRLKLTAGILSNILCGRYICNSVLFLVCGLPVLRGGRRLRIYFQGRTIIFTTAHCRGG